MSRPRDGEKRSEMVPCAQCGTPRKVMQSQRMKRVFCSVRCYGLSKLGQPQHSPEFYKALGESRRGSKNPAWKGGPDRPQSLDRERFLTRVMGHVLPEPNSGCWFWMGCINPGGYGLVGPGPQGSQLAHRAIYEATIGKVPKGLDLDHLCRVRSCVNPRHLEPVSREVNSRRGIGGGNPEKTRQRALQRTHCSFGHAWAENTYYSKGNRYCGECNRIRARKVKAASREARLSIKEAVTWHLEASTK